MDLSKFTASNEFATLALENPATGEPLMQDDGITPVTIKAVGPDSDEFKRHRHKMLDQRVKDALKSGGRPKINAEHLDQEGLNLLVACTKSWDGIVVGEALPFSEANARMLYTRFPWIREQVDAFIGNRANFLGNS